MKIKPEKYAHVWETRSTASQTYLSAFKFCDHKKIKKPLLIVALKFFVKTKTNFKTEKWITQKVKF